jgi:hypothetical protein
MKLASGILALSLAAASHSLTLTGINGTPSDSIGNWEIGWYNTYGSQNDVGKNAYVSLGNSLTSQFVNSGNGPDTMINIDLSVPGTYHLVAFFDGNEIYPGRDFWALNLFFNGQNHNPGISAVTTPSYSEPGPDSTFWASSGATKNLSGYGDTFAAGSLIYQSGHYSVALTKYTIAAQQSYSLDRVSQYGWGVNDRDDHVVELTLLVVPEPTTVMALAVGAVALLRRRRR